LSELSNLPERKSPSHYGSTSRPVIKKQPPGIMLKIPAPNTAYRNLREMFQDRAQLDLLVDALEVSRRNIRKNECDQWSISGNGNRLETFQPKPPACYVVHIDCGESVRKWSGIKRKAKALGLKVTMHCEAEGFIFLPLPDRRQAAFIRNVLGLRKKPGGTSIRTSNKKGVLEPHLELS
jgi:hypothetical protein